MKFGKDDLLLYGVTDRSWLNGKPLAQAVEEAISGGVTCIQLREKAMEQSTFLEEARAIRALCREKKVPFLVNDDIEVALQSGADGVHVGQHDLDAAQVRAMIGPDKILGVSAQTVEQARKAEAGGADYLGVGAVFPTGTKQDADAVSYETLQAICRAVKIPVVAIGGIHLENLPALRGSGIAGVALVSAIFAASNIEEDCKALRAAAEEAVRPC